MTGKNGLRLAPGHPHRKRDPPSVLTATGIVQRAKTAAVATDGTNRIAACNKHAKALLGCDVHGCQAGNRLYSTLQARDSFGNLLFDCHLAFIEVLSQGEAVKNFEIQVTRPSGQVVRVAVSVVIVLGEEDEGEAYVYFLKPVLRRRRADEAIERLLSDPKKASVTLGARSEEGSQPSLTPRQLNILELLADGLSDKEIASSECISIHTVRNHIRAILSALDVSNRAQAVARAFRERLI